MEHKKIKGKKRKAFKWLPDGRDWGWGLGAGPESDCSGLKRTRGAFEAAQAE